MPSFKFNSKFGNQDDCVIQNRIQRLPKSLPFQEFHFQKKFQVPVDLESGLRKQRGQESVKSSLEKESISSVNLGQDVESADKLVNCRGIRAFKVFADKEEDIGKNEAQPASSTRKLH